MITTSAILKAIEDGGWKLAREPHLHWVSKDRVIVYQDSDYGCSAFEMKIKGDRIVFFRVLRPTIEDAKGIEAMTLEEIIIHIWGMAIASVRPGTEPYDANVVRQNTLKWASFELNARMELALQAGMKKVADYANNFAGIKHNPEWCRTFYLIDLKKQNEKLFWRWTGTPVEEWKEVMDMQSFLETYFPPSWHSLILKTMGTTPKRVECLACGREFWNTEFVTGGQGAHCPFCGKHKWKFKNSG